MKKSLAVVLGLMSASVFASTAADQPTQPVQQKDTRPMLKFGIFDKSNKVASEVAGNELSLSKKNLELCWVAFNMPLEDKVNVIEVIKSPKKAKFSSNSGTGINSSADGLNHVITETLASYNREAVERCWKFTKEDPLGHYQFDIQVGNIKYPTQSFELVK
ncbi:hypothetical protein BMT54_05565 [Pasteurellaceae bacterium 15-036681]|nr:hypothetical protein BMT54_05565 [Pasteurellaceae bacterium 15-036681]